MSKFIKLGFGQGFIDLNTLTIIDYYTQYAEDTDIQESKPEIDCDDLSTDKQLDKDKILTIKYPAI